jgi:hypothetical protein
LREVVYLVLELREMVYLVIELREKKQTFMNVEGEKVNIFLYIASLIL